MRIAKLTSEVRQHLVEHSKYCLATYISLTLGQEVWLPNYQDKEDALYYLITKILQIYIKLEKDTLIVVLAVGG